MISNNCNTFSVDVGIPRKMDGTNQIMCYTHDAVYRPFLRGIPTSTENDYSHSLNIIQDMLLLSTENHSIKYRKSTYEKDIVEMHRASCQ